MLLISRLLDHIKPDFVHVLIKGKIVESGGYELVKKIEEKMVMRVSCNGVYKTLRKNFSDLLKTSDIDHAKQNSF